MERDSSLNTQTKGGEFAMELPLVSDFLTTVRLATGGVCAVSGLDVDYTEDIKVCVTEGLLILKRNGYARARVSFFFAENGKMRAFRAGTRRKRQRSRLGGRRNLVCASFGAGGGKQRNAERRNGYRHYVLRLSAENIISEE